MFTGHAGVCAEAEQGADKHVRLIQLTILLLSKGAAAEIHASLHPEQKIELGAQRERTKSA